MGIQIIIFGILAVLAIASAFLTISSKNPIVSAMALVAHFFMLAGLYLTLQAQFIAIMQILVYAGAIMVLVIFVIMLLNLGNEEKLKEKFNYKKVLAYTLGFALLVELAVVYVTTTNYGKLPEESLRAGTAEQISTVFFKHYLVPFEAIGLLLLMAIIGAVVLAKRKINE